MTYIAGKQTHLTEVELPHKILPPLSEPNLLTDFPALDMNHFSHSTGETKFLGLQTLLGVHAVG
jgi:hypothetical protein